MQLIAPHLADPTDWPYKQIAKPKYYKFHKTLGLAHSLYPDQGFDQRIKKLPVKVDASDVFYHPTQAYQCPESAK